MNECFGLNFMINGELHPATEFNASLIYEGESVYEVIRVKGGIPLFFNDHMERLVSSVNQQGKIMLASPEDIRKQIVSLSRSDRKHETNLKIVFNFNKGINSSIVYFIEPIYPSRDQYANGVKGILYFAERNDPGSKVINHRLRSSIYHRLILENAYEAVLVNSEDRITEGSRSNVFLVKNDILYTAPDECVLGGITRKHILDICREKGMSIVFDCIAIDKLCEFESAFMTGTSPMVLPFHTIGDVSFKVSNPLINMLRQLYIERAEKSIMSFRRGKG